MASLKITITSVEMIKPSNPTPVDAKTHQLSFIDQFAVPIHTPFIFYYPHAPGRADGDDPSAISKLLKRSMSETLVHFYQLAGRLQGNESIECNDEGVEFIEAQVSCNLSQVLESTEFNDELNGLLPIAADTVNKDTVLAVQINHFNCGGVAIGVSMSHKVGDATSLAAFVNAWAAKASDSGVGGNSIDPNTISPKFIEASLFPPIDFAAYYNPENNICKEKLITRRLIFDSQKIAALKQEASSEIVTNPTRVEVVSAFIWKCLIASAKAKSDPPELLGASHIVSLRGKMPASVPKEGCFGNIFWTSIAVLSDEKVEYNEMVSKIRKAIRSLDENYVKKLQNGEGFFEMVKAGGQFFVHQGPKQLCSFTSYVNLDIYDVNFGWGKPGWVSSVTRPFVNQTMLFRTKCGQGIEAWVNLLPDDVSAFDQFVSQELLATV